jgi:hypothetical protein
MARGTAQLRKRVRRPAPAHAVPREGLVGAHTTKREPEARGEEVEQMELEDVAAEPMGPGADVAPTKRAEERERTRHQLERDLGRVPAGEEGALRERRADDVTSDSLARAARAADRSVTGHDVPGRKG